MLMKHTLHQRLLNLVKGAICYGNSRCHTYCLTGEASLTEELTCVQNRDDRFFALWGDNGELHLASPYVEQRIRWLPLQEDVAGISAFYDRLPPEDAVE